MRLPAGKCGQALGARTDAVLPELHWPVLTAFRARSCRLEADPLPFPGLAPPGESAADENSAPLRRQPHPAGTTLPPSSRKGFAGPFSKRRRNAAVRRVTIGTAVRASRRANHRLPYSTCRESRRHDGTSRGTAADTGMDFETVKRMMNRTGKRFQGGARCPAVLELNPGGP